MPATIEATTTTLSPDETPPSAPEGASAVEIDFPAVRLVEAIRIGPLATPVREGDEKPRLAYHETVEITEVEKRGDLP